MPKLWPTPRASDVAAGRTLNEKGQRISKTNPDLVFGANLADAVKVPEQSEAISQSQQLTLFAGVIHASPLVRPGSEAARKMTVTSGQKCIGSWLPSGPVGSLLKMLLGTSQWASTACFLTWKVKVTPAGRLFCQLAPSAPRIEETEFGLWATPKASTSGPDFAKVERSPGSGLSLPTMVAMWPTPTTQDASNNGGPSQLDRNTPPLNAVAGGSLNPTWVEWLMGYPEGWTDLED
jgi:hypothetical protein